MLPSLVYLRADVQTVEEEEKEEQAFWRAKLRIMPKSP